MREFVRQTRKQPVHYTGCGVQRVDVDPYERPLVTSGTDSCPLVRLVQNPIAASGQAALEDALLVAISIQGRACAAVEGTVCGALTDITVDRTGNRADGCTGRAASGDTFCDYNFVGVSLAFLPIQCECVGINPLHIDDRVGVCCAACKGHSENRQYGWE